MSNEIVKRTPEEEKKFIAWGKMGVDISQQNDKLHILAQTAIAKLKKPTTVSEIAEAEAVLKEVDKDFQACQNQRQDITRKFDTVTEKLMAHEKSIKAAQEPVKAAILELKRVAADIKAKADEKAAEEKKIREAMLNYCTKHDAESKRKILEMVNKVYAQALMQNITPENVQKHLDIEKHKNFMLVDFDIKKPSRPATVKHVTQEEYDKMWAESMAANCKESVVYLNAYRDDLLKKFEFYNVAWSQKEAAIEQSNKEVQEKQAAILKEEGIKKAANALEATATTMGNPVNTTGYGKELKHAWIVDMPNDEQNGILVIAAFVGNIDRVREGVRVKKFFSLSIEQMAAALAWYKNKDEKFECTGILFKKVDK